MDPTHADDSRRLPDALEKTVPADEFSADATARQLDPTLGDEPSDLTPDRFLSATARDLTPPGPDETREFRGFTTSTAVPEELLEEEEEAGPRFDAGEELGRGGTAHVYAVRDRSLGRTIALKLLRGRGERKPGVKQRFVHEARVTAMLEHPNIVPIYDIGVTDDNRVYFLMKNITGVSIGDAIRACADGQETPREFSALESRVRIMLKVCDAMAYAHAHGFVHQDLKPDNIMLGRYGEVLVLDWGCAVGPQDRQRGATFGTPAYMAPEQARRERADERSDVYCLGATLFHMLTLRYPTHSDDPEEFWQKKRDGVVDETTEEERERVPAPLLSICLRAMAVDAGERYQSVTELADDLEAYQTGLSVKAHRDTLRAWAARWYRRNRTPFWSGSAIAVVVAAAALVGYQWKLKEIARWGRPVLVERFEDDSWQQRWRQVAEGRFLRRDGRLVSDTADGTNFQLVYTKKLFGDVAVEFEGEMLAGCQAGDLSLVWYEDIGPPGADGRATPSGDIYTFQTGAFDNTVSAIRHKSADRGLAHNQLRLEHGKRYRLRAEIDGQDLRLKVDGRTLCTYRLPYPLGSGYVGLYAYYGGKAFDNVKVYVKGVAEKVGVLAVGDSYFRRRLYREAIAEYAMVAASHAGRPIAVEARYRQGMCYHHWAEEDSRDTAASRGHRDSAYAVWETLRGSKLDDLVEYRFAVRDLEGGRLDLVLDRIERQFRTAGPEGRQRFCDLWSRLVVAETKGDRWRVLTRAIDVQQRFFPDDRMYHRPAASALNLLGRHEDVLARCPHLVWERGNALIHLRRYEDLLTQFPDLYFFALRGLLGAGRYDEALAAMKERQNLYGVAAVLSHMGRAEEAVAICSAMRPPRTATWARGRLERHEETLNDDRAGDDTKAKALIPLGRAHEVLATYPAERSACASALIHLRKFEQVLAEYPDVEGGCLTALLGLGRYDEAIALLGERRPDEAVSYVLAFGEYQRRGGEAREVFDSLLSVRPDFYGFSSALRWRFFTVPFLQMLDGDTAAFERSIRTVIESHRYKHGQRLWHAAKYLAGEIDDREFMSQPDRAGLVGEHSLLQAMRAEYRGDERALQHYRRYQGLGYHLRHSRWFDDLFAKWRVEQLSREKT